MLWAMERLMPVRSLATCRNSTEIVILLPREAWCHHLMGQTQKRNLQERGKHGVWISVRRLILQHFHRRGE